MRKEYPLRPKPQPRFVDDPICECGHNDYQHTYTTTLPEDPDLKRVYEECKLCMCPKYELDEEKPT